MSDDFFERVGTNLRTSNKDRERREKEFASEVSAAPTALMNKLQESPNQNTNRLWLVSDDLYFEGEATSETLPLGMFEVDSLDAQTVLRKIKINTDELIVPSDKVMGSILAEFDLFWQSKAAFEKRGLLHKRGFLLWGPAGGGKTCLIQLLIQSLLKSGGVVVKIDHPKLGLSALKIIRKIEPERRLVLILEDLDALIEKYGESDYLSLLDGEDQISNVAVLATTNYPEHLDPRIVNRPSRFDKIIEIGMPNAETRKSFLLNKEPELSAKELAEWVAASNDFSLAHLREMIIAVKCLGQPFEETVERLRSMRIKPKSSDGFRPIGFKD